MSDRDKKIRERAHALWEAEGKPNAKHDEHWSRAQQELAAEEHSENPAGADDDAPSVQADVTASGAE